MAVDEKDVTGGPLLEVEEEQPEGEIELDPTATPSPESSAGEGGKESAGPEAQVGGETPTAESARPAGQTVPYERFQEVSEKLKRYEPLSPLAELIQEDPTAIHDIKAAIVERRLGATRQDQQAQQVQQPAQPQLSPEQQIARLNEAFQQNPVGTMLAVANEIAKKQVADRTGGLEGTTAQLAIQSFKMSNAANPVFKQLEPYFDKVVGAISPQEFAKGPEYVRGVLNTAYYTALGLASDAALKRAQASGSRGKAPNYGAGAATGSGSGKRVRVPAHIVRMMRANGFSDAEIAKAWEEENS